MALIRKNSKSDATSAPKQKIIKVNPYENPENVMELMSTICSAKASADTNNFWAILNEAYYNEANGISLCDYLKKNRSQLANFDFEHDLYNFSQQISWSITTRENTEHTQIVVAGGFSSGKSSFLNTITNSVGLLPTGVEPVSVVKTYLYCSKDCKCVSVKGVNHKNVLVDLNTGVLQSIQHSSKSNIYLASVLDKLFVEIPSDLLNGLVFIDTPGYNNSDRANDSNGVTDRATTLDALGEGNVLFWLIDCEKGTAITDDLEIIKQFSGKKVIIFNKADKKGEKECEKIVDAAAKILYKEFSRDEIIDILAFSTLENKTYASVNNMSLPTIISETKKTGNGRSELNEFKHNISELFDNEISESQKVIQKLIKSHKEAVTRKNALQNEYNKAKELKDNIISDLKILSESYESIDHFMNSSKQALDYWCDFYNEVLNFEQNDHWGSSYILTKAIALAENRYPRCVEEHNDILAKTQYFDIEYRNNLIDIIEQEEDFAVDKVKEVYDEACVTCNDLVNRKDVENDIVLKMKKYKEMFMAALECGIKQYQNQNKATNIRNDEYSFPNIFECIKKDDYKLFLHSFEDGVDLSVCNADGYNPLTLAVHVGNNMMVRFMLDHDADPSIKDKRGYNAFHTAVEDQYRDICKILLDIDPDLIDTTTDSGESVEDLAQKQTFSKWIKQEIDNAL